MDSGREQNYWPGFVDALSNVVLTLVFVLVIFVFALVMASNKVEKKMQEVVQSQQDQKAASSQVDAVKQASASEEAELRSQLAAAVAEVQKLKEQIAKDTTTAVKTGAVNQSAVTADNTDKQIAIEDKAPPAPKQGSIQIKSTATGLILNYPLTVTEMDDKSATELGHIIEALEKSTGKHKVILRSIVGKETYSAARRLAYYRAIGARNVFITKGGESPSNITTILVTPPQPEDGRVEVVFEKQ